MEVMVNYKQDFTTSVVTYSDMVIEQSLGQPPVAVYIEGVIATEKLRRKIGIKLVEEFEN